MHELTLGALQYYFIIGICKIITTILTLILFIFTTRKTSLFIFYGLITLVNLALFVQSAETTSGAQYSPVSSNFNIQISRIIFRDGADHT